MDMIIFVLFILFMTILVLILSTSAKKTGRPMPSSPIIENSHQWHEPSGEYGSNHKDIVDDHVVAHAQPELGYVVLNGIKRRLEDCKYL
jgi:hypothetical protein